MDNVLFKARQDPTSEARQNPMLTRKNDNQKSTYDYFQVFLPKKTDIEFKYTCIEIQY